MLGAINFVIKYWKLIVSVVVFVLNIFVGFYIANKFWSWKYNELEGKYNGCVTSLNGCLSANEENQKTIEALREEIKQKNKICEERVNYYKKLLSEIQRVDSLTGGQSEKPVSNTCSDDICSELYRMFKSGN